MDTETQNLVISKNIFEVAKSFAEKADFAYTGDFLEDILFREVSKMKAQEDLYVKIQEGIDSGLVEADDKFWLDFEKKLGVKKSFKNESLPN